MLEGFRMRAPEIKRERDELEVLQSQCVPVLAHRNNKTLEGRLINFQT